MLVTSDVLAVINWIDEGNSNYHDLPTEPSEDENHSSLNSDEAALGKGIYDLLARHQVTGEWRYRELAAELHRWAVIFNREFNLEVSQIALRVDWLACRTLGHFRSGHNGFGLKGEIAINERHLHRRDPWQVLGTVLHELLHAWQEEHGKPGKPPYHNKQFRAKALQYGLVIDEDGVTHYLDESPFKALLNHYGVRMPDQPLPPRRASGDSKLKKWACRCPVNVRVAVADFQARCLKCRRVFTRAE